MVQANFNENFRPIQNRKKCSYTDQTHPETGLEPNTHTHTRTYVAHTLSRSWLTIRKNHMKKSMKLRKTVFSLITASTSRSSEFANSQ